MHVSRTFSITVAIWTACHASATLAADPDFTSRSRTAIEKSLPYLATYGRSWMNGELDMQDNKSCVSCHYVNFAVWGLNVAGAIGLKIPTEETEALTRDSIQFIGNQEVGRVVSWSHAMMANANPSEEDREEFAKWAGWFPKRQNDAGFWAAKGQFPSQAREVAESNAVATMWAVTALRGYQDQPNVSKSVQEALAWLDDSPAGVTSEWMAWKLVTDHHRERKESAGETRRKLLELQNDDGGWSWLAKNPSDAFATGQALYALLRTDADAAATDEVRATVEYLLNSQGDDGEWAVASELISTLPDEYRDHIYSFWGTAWATIALSEYVYRRSDNQVVTVR